MLVIGGKQIEVHIYRKPLFVVDYWYYFL